MEAPNESPSPAPRKRSQLFRRDFLFGATAGVAGAKAWEWAAPPEHVHLFSPRSIRRLLAEAGAAGVELSSRRGDANELSDRPPPGCCRERHQRGISVSMKRPVAAVLGTGRGVPAHVMTNNDFAAIGIET